jgi:hypothetical protein
MQHDETSGDGNMKPYEQATNSASACYQLDRVRMSPAERRMARAYLRQAELLADMLLRVDAVFRRVLGFAERGISALAHRSKVPPVTPAPN